MYAENRHILSKLIDHLEKVDSLKVERGLNYKAGLRIRYKRKPICYRPLVSFSFSSCHSLGPARLAAPTKLHFITLSIQHSSSIYSSKERASISSAIISVVFLLYHKFGCNIPGTAALSDNLSVLLALCSG